MTVVRGRLYLLPAIVLSSLIYFRVPAADMKVNLLLFESIARSNSPLGLIPPYDFPFGIVSMLIMLVASDAKLTLAIISFITYFFLGEAFFRHFRSLGFKSPGWAASIIVMAPFLFNAVGHLSKFLLAASLIFFGRIAGRGLANSFSLLGVAIHPATVFIAVSLRQVSSFPLVLSWISLSVAVEFLFGTFSYLAQRVADGGFPDESPVSLPMIVILLAISFIGWFLTTEAHGIRLAKRKIGLIGQLFFVSTIVVVVSSLLGLNIVAVRYGTLALILGMGVLLLLFSVSSVFKVLVSLVFMVLIINDIINNVWSYDFSGVF